MIKIPTIFVVNKNGKWQKPVWDWYFSNSAAPDYQQELKLIRRLLINLIRRLKFKIILLLCNFKLDENQVLLNNVYLFVTTDQPRINLIRIGKEIHTECKVNKKLPYPEGNGLLEPDTKYL